ncbi:MAG: PEP/pyruvate-binding domain-containing protein, partial [Gammaproteobacteria bacterium]
MTQLVIGLSEVAAADATRFGPKAANQAALGHAGLPIPEGYVVDAAAYRIQLESLGLAESARAAAAEAFEEARRHISQVRIALFDEPIVPEVLEPLMAARQSLVDRTGALLVVRSSALLEDQAGSTFAGQFESFLGLESEEDFITAVRACWAALWASRARQYMTHHDLTPADTAMGLLIQPLVEARASGGGMSLTADESMLLTATWGLGSAIAQGEIVPDRYDLDRDGNLRDVTAGRKSHSIQCVHHQAEPSAQAVAGIRIQEPCLNKMQVQELGSFLKRAEDLLGQPVEIEWAQDDAGFKMLQARPLKMEPAAVPDEIWLRHPGIQGHPSGIGWGSGRACVINCECELSRLAPGDVLVTKVAGPALSQVLPRVSGVVA